jgi:hypothetical protein
MGSAQILVPLILGLLGIFAFMIYEALVPNEPIFPIKLLNDWTVISG